MVANRTPICECESDNCSNGKGCYHSDEDSVHPSKVYYGYDVDDSSEDTVSNQQITKLSCLFFVHCFSPSKLS